MSNIYLKQMNELKIDVEQYSKLLDTPIFIVRRLLKGETLSEDMGLNEFIRNNILKKYNELENNKIETQSKVIKLKIENKEKNNELLEWYKNEFDKNVLMQKYNCKKELELYRKIPLTTKPRYTKGKKFSTNEIISLSTFNRLINKKSISLEFLMHLLEQLKKYYDSEIKENFVKEDFTTNKKTSESDLLKWHYDFDYRNFMEKHNLTNKIMAEDLKLGKSTMGAITNPLKNYSPSDDNLKKVKEYIENFGKKEEKMKEIEIIDEDIIETHCETNTNTSNSNEIETLDTFIEKEEKSENECLNDVLRSLLKNRLTEEEKRLIEIFGGKVC